MKKPINDFIYNRRFLHPMGEWWIRRGPEVRAVVRSILIPFVVAHVIAFVLRLLQSFLKRLRGNDEHYEFRS